MPPAARGAATPSSNNRADGQAFPKGSTVEVQGLINAAELNGKIGTVTGFDHYKERFVVFVNGDYKALKGTNLKTAPRPAQTTTASSEPSRTSANRAQPQRTASRTTAAGADASASWKDQLQVAMMSAKAMCEEVVKRIQLWTRSGGTNWWSSSPFPKMIVTLLIAGLVIYWMSSDPRYSGAPRSKPHYVDDAGQYGGERHDNRYDRRDAPQRPRTGRRVDEYDNYQRRDDYSEDDYGRQGSGYDQYSQQDYGRQDYNTQQYGSSGGSSMMWMMLLGGAFLAYRAGLFERLRGMNFFQLYFLFNILSSMFGGMRMMGRPGMGGMGGMGRGFGRRGYR
eukprot:GEMP01047617.1.p1 GENE.GEMP01047617.1~~GEMP01047617.1.p1  ORF type:complete len:337 (+),score=62.97 GEMP01047617.1:108-1118(+)